MAGNGIPNTESMTKFLLLICVMSAFSGFIIGYMFGIIGGVVLMPEFLKEYLFGDGNTVSSTFNSESVIFHTSSFHLIAMAAVMYSYMIPRIVRSRLFIMFGGISFLAGAVLSATASSILMFNFSRGLLGLGFGYIYQQVPLYISETVHNDYRGAISISFHTMATIGIFVANLVNYGTNHINGGWGWRVSFGLVALPATVISVVCFLLPSSIIEQVLYKWLLQRIRGYTIDIDDKEFNHLLAAGIDEASKKEHWTENILDRKHRPYFVMAIAIPTFQNLTGINAMVFYAPILLKTIGFDSNTSLMFTVVIGGVNVAATFLAIILVDRLRRRSILIAGGLQIFVCQIILAGTGVMATGTTRVDSTEYANLLVVVAFICMCVSGFAWSWGPLGWLVPSEVFPLEIRSAGEFISVSVNYLFTCLMTWIFLSMFYHFKFNLFYIFAFFTLTKTLFVIFFLPEMKGITTEDMSKVWKQHWFWKRYVTNLVNQDVDGSQIDVENQPANVIVV